MLKQLRALLFAPKSSQLTISSHGQKTCGLPFDEIREVMEWLSLSLMAAGYQAKAHIIWDNPEAPIPLDRVFQDSLRRDEPTFLYRCGARPLQPPSGRYWRLMSEYPTLRVYQLERREG